MPTASARGRRNDRRIGPPDHEHHVMNIWRGQSKLLLASQSRARKMLLENAGLDFEALPANIDERAVQRESGLSAPGEIASLLAREKALFISRQKPGQYVIGADQTLTLEGKILHKSRDLAEGAQTLAALSGKTHRLTSAFCVARAGQALVVHRDHADLRMRTLDLAEISRYLERAGPSVLSSVGVYQGESLGIHLFEHIEGDHSVVLGLSMLSLLAWMRRENLISL